jgi:CheY-like chemotaxis protein
MKMHYVMMVDDDSYTTELFNMIIDRTPLGKYFVTIEDPKKALENLKELYHGAVGSFPEYILLDLKMPEIEGFEFIREFERNFPERKNKTFFIITTSSIMEKDKREAQLYPSIKDYMIKPIPCNFIEKLITQGFS